ncbi:hypothetical protein [Fodinibius sp. AD559]|uniref:hypothetical protein n=1 Tax=Fodinibius sp. AD559 TaxID=3424179 RepID=UPI004046A7F0
MVSANKTSDIATKNKESTFSLTFFVGMAIYLTVIVIAGFWPTYFGPYFSGEEVGHPKSLIENTLILHVHGLIMLT